MLELPKIGFNRSVDQINVDRIKLADWLEASVVFGDGDVSRAAIADVLAEEGVAGDQDIGNAVADEGIAQLALRLSRAPSITTFEVVGTDIEKRVDWREHVGSSFVLLLSLSPLYPQWALANRDYITQGLLFERFCEVVCSRLFSGWDVCRTGWTPNGQADIPTIVQYLSTRLFTSGHADPATWAGQHANDAGLDLLCYRPFGDDRQGLPYYTLQCASGVGWTGKLHQPCTKEWMKLLDAAFEPTRGLLIPFEVESDEIKRRSLRIGGPLLDRTRLLGAAGNTNAWLPDALVADLLAWLEPRVQSLPFAA